VIIMSFPQQQQSQGVQKSPSNFFSEFEQSQRGGSPPHTNPLSSIPSMESVFRSESESDSFMNTTHNEESDQFFSSNNQPGFKGLVIPSFDPNAQFLVICGEEYFFHSETKSFIPVSDPEFCQHFIRWRDYIVKKNLEDRERVEQAELERQMNDLRMSRLFPNQQQAHQSPPPPPQVASFLQSRVTSPPPRAVSPQQQQQQQQFPSDNCFGNSFNNSSFSNTNTKGFSQNSSTFRSSVTPSVNDRFCNVCNRTPASHRYPTCRSCYSQQQQQRR